MIFQHVSVDAEESSDVAAVLNDGKVTDYDDADVGVKVNDVDADVEVEMTVDDGVAEVRVIESESDVFSFSTNPIV